MIEAGAAAGAPAGAPAARGLERVLVGAEAGVAVAALSLMALLPAIEVAARHLHLTGLPGSAVLVQQLTLWVTLAGAALAAQERRLLALSTANFIPRRGRRMAELLSAAFCAAISAALAWASWQFVAVERLGGERLAMGLPVWLAQAIMPLGFALIAGHVIWSAAPSAKGRIVAAIGLLLPWVFNLGGAHVAAFTTIGAAAILVAAGLGLPIFATLGGVALLLFWAEGVPVASVPAEAYRL
ncbi:MAG: TRAP transporter small permease, partial [Terriglobales bacterium]